MALFSKKNNQADMLAETGVSNELDHKTIPFNQDPGRESFSEIIRTTDSMNFLIDSTQNDRQNEELMKLTRESIAQNYDLARRRINATYQDVIDSGAYVGLSFIAVQLSLINFNRSWDVNKVLDVITIFTDEIFATLSTGVGVEISSELFFEVVVYVDKVLLASRISPKFVSEIRAITWEKLFDRLVKDNKLALSDRTIVENFTYALDENVRRGYYVQLGDFILARVNFESRSTILLYSHERLVRLNHDFQTYRDQQKQQIVSVSDDVVNMQHTLAKIAQEEADAKTRRKPSPQPDESFRAKDDGRPRKAKRDSLKARRERRRQERKKMIQAEKTLEKTLEFDAKLMQHESMLPTTALDEQLGKPAEDQVEVKNPTPAKDAAPVVTKRWFAKKIRKGSGQSAKKASKSHSSSEKDQLGLTNPTHLESELPSVVAVKKTKSKKSAGKASRSAGAKSSSKAGKRSTKPMAKKSQSQSGKARRMKRGGAIGKGTD